MHRKNHGLYIFVILVAIMLFSMLTIYASSSVAEALRVSARAATLYEPESGVFLYSKNENERLPMASTTKIMTAIVVAEACEPEEIVKIAPEAVGIEGSSAYLSAGECFSVEELLYALLLSSANDAAAALAYHVAGSIDGFATLMNEKAAELGLSDTHFSNPHGLDDSEHYTTAHDLALIAACAVKNDRLRQICSTYKKSFVSEERSRTYVNHNKLLNSYDGSIGMKTGFTKKSGRCLVGAAERGGLTFISVTLDAPSDWSDHRQMLDYGYDKLEKITFARAGDYSYDLKLLEGEAASVRVQSMDDASVILPRGEYEVKEYIKLPRYTVAPVKRGDILGTVVFTLDGKYAAEVKLVSTEDAPVRERESFFKKIYNAIFG